MRQENQQLVTGVNVSLLMMPLDEGCIAHLEYPVRKYAAFVDTVIVVPFGKSRSSPPNQIKLMGAP
jgi:hypothetical protein